MQHDEHGEIELKTLDTRIHDNEEMWYCTRCGHYVPKDEPEQFDEIDCDNYKQIRENIS